MNQVSVAVAAAILAQYGDDSHFPTLMQVTSRPQLFLTVPLSSNGASGRRLTAGHLGNPILWDETKSEPQPEGAKRGLWGQARPSQVAHRPCWLPLAVDLQSDGSAPVV